MTLVSIIIPCYNCSSTIERAVKSIYSQSHSNWEIILVDNNSTDDTLDMLHRLQSEKPEKITVLEEKKKGAPAARNKGLAVAKGEWIEFLDADDELLPEKIAAQLKLAAPNVSIIVGNCLIYENSIRKRIVIKKDVKAADKWSGLINSSLGITSANLWLKSALNDINGWNEALSSSQEYDLLFRLFEKDAEIAIDTNYNTIIHKMSTSISRSNDAERITRILTSRYDLRERIKKHLVKKNLWNPAREDAHNIYVYRNLMRNKPMVPDFYKANINSVANKIPVKIKAREHYKYWRNLLKQQLKSTLIKLKIYRP